MQNLDEYTESETTNESDFNMIFEPIVRETIPVILPKKLPAPNQSPELYPGTNIDDLLREFTKSEKQQTTELKRVDLSKYSENEQSAEDWSFLYENDTIVYKFDHDAQNETPKNNGIFEPKDNDATLISRSPLYKTLFSSKENGLSSANYNRFNPLSIETPDSAAFREDTSTLFNKKSNLHLLNSSRTSILRDSLKTPTYQNFQTRKDLSEVKTLVEKNSQKLNLSLDVESGPPSNIGYKRPTVIKKLYSKDEPISYGKMNYDPERRQWNGNDEYNSSFDRSLYSAISSTDLYKRANLVFKSLKPRKETASTSDLKRLRANSIEAPPPGVPAHTKKRPTFGISQLRKTTFSQENHTSESDSYHVNDHILTSSSPADPFIGIDYLEEKDTSCEEEISSIFTPTQHEIDTWYKEAEEYAKFCKNWFPS